jgi:hypothetical protein
VGLVDIFISVLSDRRLELLLIGYDLNVVSGCCESESHSLPIAYTDLIYIDLDAGVLAVELGTFWVIWQQSARYTRTGILILLDLQVIGSSGDWGLLPNIPKCQCLIIAYDQCVDIGVLSLRELHKSSIRLENPCSENIHTAASSQAIITLRHCRKG